MLKLHSVAPVRAEAKMIGEEPTWEVGSVTDKNYNAEMIRGINWHAYVADKVNYRQYLVEWVKNNKFESLAKVITSAPESAIDNSIAIIARMALNGFPLNEKHLDVVRTHVTTIVSVPKSTEDVPTTSPNIQERMQNQVQPILAMIDHSIDDCFANGTTADIVTITNSIVSLKAPQLKLVQNHIQKYTMEWSEALAGIDPELTAAYGHAKKFLPKISKQFNEVLTTVEDSLTKMKSARIVKKRPVDKKKIASKLKLMKADVELGITSVPAVSIIGATTAWVYDTKKRKLGYYESKFKNGLFIRGTVIDGYDTSCVKTLRKPQEQLQKFMKLRKNQCVAFLDEIKAKCGELSGRTNNEVILLRVD